MKILLKINLISIIVVILLNLFSVYFYYSILKEERIRMEDHLKQVFEQTGAHRFQDENDRRMFALMSGVSDKEYNDNFKTSENTDQGMLDEVNCNKNNLNTFDTNRIYNALSEDIIGNTIQQKSLDLAQKEKSDMWGRLLNNIGEIDASFNVACYQANRDPKIAREIIQNKNIDKYRQSNPEFFEEKEVNGKKELQLKSTWNNLRNMYQTANKENKQYHATESMNFIFDNMDDKQKDAIKIALNKDKNNAMTSGFIQMDKLFRSNSNDYGMIQNFINSYGSKGKELVYRLMTEDPTTDTLKSYVEDTETSEMIQKVTGLNGEEFLKQLRAFSSQAEKGLKSRGSAFKNQSDMIKVGKRDEKGNFTGNVTRLPLWTPYDDDINFEEENKRIEKNRGELEAIRAWMNDIHAGTSYSPEIHKRIIDDWLAERNKNK